MYLSWFVNSKSEHRPNWHTLSVKSDCSTQMCAPLDTV